MQIILVVVGDDKNPATPDMLKSISKIWNCQNNNDVKKIIWPKDIPVEIRIQEVPESIDGILFTTQNWAEKMNKLIKELQNKDEKTKED